MVIADAGLAGLVACALAVRSAESEGAQVSPSAWFTPVGDAHDDARRAALRVQAGVLSMDLVGESARTTGNADGRGETQMLLDACHEAIRLRIPRIIWGIQIGGDSSDDWPDLDDLASRLDRALLCARLASLDAPRVGPGDVRIETPLIDLTDRQLAELAVDLAVPFESLWWWQTDRDNDESSRWRDLLASAGSLSF